MSRLTLDMLSSIERIRESALTPARAMGLTGGPGVSLLEMMMGRYSSIIMALDANKIHVYEDECPLLDEIEGTVISCPGHTRDHSCILWREYIFVGDTVLPDSSPTIIDYSSYVESLVGILGETSWSLLAPGHGSILDRGGAVRAIARILRGKSMRLARTLAVVGEEWTSFNTLLEKVYGVKPGIEAYVAARTLVGYLRALEDEGLVEVDRGATPWMVRRR